ncbi:MAG TPA: hypothetical protein VF511_02270 [Chthoniobacterales bacterium]
MPDASSRIDANAVTVFDGGLPVTLEDAVRKKEAISRALRRSARKARAPAGIISGGTGFHARKGVRAFRIGLLVSLMVLVICPVLVESVYWGLIASKQYSTEMKFAVRTGESSPLSGLGGILGSSQQSQDTQIVADYIRSRAMIEALGDRIDLRKVYGRDGVDYFSRFDPTDSMEELQKYWHKRVDTKIEMISGIVSVDVRAFTPEESLALGSAILELSEKLVNDLSTRSRRDALDQARLELSRAEQRLQTASTAMRDARNAEGVLDATAAAEALSKVVTALRLELARAEQDIASQGAAYESPQTRVIQARVGSIKAQIDDYSRQIADVDVRRGSSTMADRLRLLSTMQVELDLARMNYAKASAIFENARTDLETQHAYLVTSLRPTLAQKSTYPRRLWEWLIVIAPCLLAWMVLVAIAFLVRDNMAR